MEPAPALRIHRPEAAVELPAVMSRRDRVVFGELLDIVSGDVGKAEELFAIVVRERARVARGEG